MGKRVDNDSTMEMSTSQLVPDVPKHDQSVWAQTVVGTDQFAPTKPRPSSSRTALWVVIAILLLATAAGAVAIFLDI